MKHSKNRGRKVTPRQVQLLKSIACDIPDAVKYAEQELDHIVRNARLLKTSLERCKFPHDGAVGTAHTLIVRLQGAVRGIQDLVDVGDEVKAFLKAEGF